MKAITGPRAPTGMLYRRQPTQVQLKRADVYPAESEMLILADPIHA